MPVCDQNQPFSHTQHFLLSAYGSRWRKVDLIMLTVYVDDSGTSPAHKIAIASAMIVPARNLEVIEDMWKAFKDEEGFDYLHASDIATPHRKGQFKGWDDTKAARVLARARRIAITHCIGAFSLAIPKQDFDSVAPEDWLRPGGTNHYTWAFRTLMHQLIGWHKAHIGSGLYDFVIDNAVGKDRYEIEMMMDQFEEENPGCFDGRY